jgi:predicted transposase/invertase (TIGR01784 family)
MKTDSIFYRIFLEFPSSFFELIDRPPDEADDYEFTSREVKQLSFRMDGLFFPLAEESEQPFYVVEVQFQPEDEFYYRLFSELFLMMKQYRPLHPWRVVVIYPSRSIEREQALQFAEMLHLNRVQRVYLNELGEAANRSLGVKIVKLVIESERTAVASAKELIEQARQQIIDEAIQRNLIDLIETIIVYKLPQKSRQEIERMLGLGDLKQTKFYQEAFAEGEEKTKLEAISALLKEGLNIEQIARALKLLPEVVQKVADQESSGD